MKKLWLLVALGVGAYLLFALLTLPASVVLARFSPPGVKTAGVAGTAWKGSAQVVEAGGLMLGSVEWDVRLLALFTARLKADIKLKRTDGFAQSAVSWSPAGSLGLEELSASLPIAVLPPGIAPGGWTGVVNMKFARLTLEQGWPTHADGTLEALDVTGPARNPANVGSYKIAFPAPQAAEASALNGALSDLGGPLQVSGTLRLSADRSYVVEGLIATRPDAPENINKVLEFLGPADAQGRRPFSFAGTL